MAVCCPHLHIGHTNELEHIHNVQRSWRQQDLSNRPASCPWQDIVQGRPADLQHLAHEAETIRVHATRGHAQDHITSGNARAVDDLVFLYRPHCKSSKIVFACRVETWHLRGLHAYEDVGCERAC